MEVSKGRNCCFSEGEVLAQNASSRMIFEHVGVDSVAGDDNFCGMLNSSSCHWTENQAQLIFTVYNQLPRSISKLVRLPIKAGKISEVFDHKGTKLDVVIIDIRPEVLNLPGRKSEATQEMIFMANEIPALGKIFFSALPLLTRLNFRLLFLLFISVQCRCCNGNKV